MSSSTKSGEPQARLYLILLLFFAGVSLAGFLLELAAGLGWGAGLAILALGPRMLALPQAVGSLYPLIKLLRARARWAPVLAVVWLVSTGLDLLPGIRTCYLGASYRMAQTGAEGVVQEGRALIDDFRRRHPDSAGAHRPEPMEDHRQGFPPAIASLGPAYVRVGPERVLIQIIGFGDFAGWIVTRPGEERGHGRVVDGLFWADPRQP